MAGRPFIPLTDNEATPGILWPVLGSTVENLEGYQDSLVLMTSKRLWYLSLLSGRVKAKGQSKNRLQLLEWKIQRWLSLTFAAVAANQVKREVWEVQIRYFEIKDFKKYIKK